MKKLVLLSLCLLFIGTVAVAESQRINILFGWPDWIDGSKPSYIEHGVHAVLMDAVDEMGFKSPRDLALQTTTLTLWIDDVEVEATGLKLPSWIDPIDGVELFDITWFWRLPANYFSEGWHTLTMHWVSSLVPLPGELWRTLTFEVTYPEKGGGN